VRGRNTFFQRRKRQTEMRHLHGGSSYYSGEDGEKRRFLSSRSWGEGVRTGPPGQKWERKKTQLLRLKSEGAEQEKKTINLRREERCRAREGRGYKLM